MCHCITPEAVVMWHVTRPPATTWYQVPGPAHWPQMTLHLPNITRHQTHFKPRHLYSSILIENGQLVSTLNIVQLWSWFEEHHQQCPLSHHCPHHTEMIWTGNCCIEYCCPKYWNMVCFTLTSCSDRWEVLRQVMWADGDRMLVLGLNMIDTEDTL